MKSSPLFFFTLAAVLSCGPAQASVDMDEPRRAVGRESDVRVDAQLVSDTIAAGTPIAIRFQIRNESSEPVAISAGVCTASYDAESGVITVGIGSEVPPDGALPRLTVIKPRETRSFVAGAALNLFFPGPASRLQAGPRSVQINVTLLRDLQPFSELIEAQQEAPDYIPALLTDELFEIFLESNETIYLNALPVRLSPRRGSGADASQRRHVGAV